MERGNRKTRVGVVVSNKMTKPVVVKVERRVSDRKYGKIERRAEKYNAHDEKQECRIGDRVRMELYRIPVRLTTVAGKRTLVVGGTGA